ncbi:MAG: RdgB/HAM1 family non-canonical purine NTP pyrophosphatase [Armatimonadota bacterium]
MKLVVATNNVKKGQEMSAILSQLVAEGLEILTLADFPPYPEPEETGSDYLENALIKAHAAVEHTGCVCIADDSGLEVAHLNGEPGIFSKRFEGEDSSWPHKIARMLEMLTDVPEEMRGARFMSCVAICCPDGAEYTFRDTCNGRIHTQPVGYSGFGFDPIFYLPDMSCTMAELSMEVKNTISHRAKTLAAAQPLLRHLMSTCP